MTRQQELAEFREDPAIADALRTAFGQVVPDVVELLSGGMSPARLYRLSLGGRRYVLRHVLGRGGTGDARRSLACLRSAAERGLAPCLRYSNVDSGITISDFIDAPTLAVWSRGGGDPVPLLARSLRALHSGPAFPAFISVPEACGHFAASLREPCALPHVSEHLAHVAVLRAALAPHIVQAPCHNDLNPGNVLVAPDRLWLVDWDAAGSGDPFHDLATLGVFVLREPEQRERLLAAYLDREPNGVERARYLLSRAQAFTAMALLFANLAQLRAAAGATADEEKPSPVGDPGAFAERMGADALALCASADYVEAIAVLR